jgi:flagellar biosynthesis/type III secretory pathway protein FliH
MIFLSKIIKNCSVSYNQLPRTIDGNSNVKVQTSGDIRCILSQNALESADISLKSALKKVAEIKEWERVESQLAFSITRKSGMERGFTDGLNKGQNEAKLFAQAKVKEDIKRFIVCTNKLDSAYMARIQNAKDECVDFAFSIAENILNMKIDREADEYKAEIATFTNRESRKAVINSDGCEYIMDTLAADALLSCAQGIEGITVRIEPQEEKTEQIDIGDKNESDVGSLTVEQQPERPPTCPPMCQKEKTAQTDIGDKNENDAGSLMVEQQPERPLTCPPMWQEEKTAQTGIEEKHKCDEQELVGIQTDDFDDSEEFNTKQSGGEVSDEKFVFVRPAHRVAVLPSGLDGAGGSFYRFEDFLFLGTDTLKAITKKAGTNDISAALQGAPEETVSLILDACPRRIKEKVLDGMKYLGPVPENEVQEARVRLAHLADELSLH